MNPFSGDSIEHFSDPKNWTFFLNTTHRIELFFAMWLKELNRIFKNLTQRIEHSSLGDKELNLLHKMTQWIEPFCEHDSQKLFWITTQRIFSHKICLTKLKELNLLFTNVSKNWTFWKTWLKELNMSHRNWTFLFYMTQRIELFFYMTQRIELFWILTQRIEPFSWIWRKNWSFSLKFWHKSKNWTSSKMTQRIQLLELSQRVKLLSFFFFLKKCLEEIFFNWLQNWTF